MMNVEMVTDCHKIKLPSDKVGTDATVSKQFVRLFLTRIKGDIEKMSIVPWSVKLNIFHYDLS